MTGVRGAGAGVLGGLTGPGGAEFRLALVMGLFGFVALHAVIMRKEIGLVVMATALPARLGAVLAQRRKPSVSMAWAVRPSQP